MSYKTLQQAFNAVFHNKEPFEDFCSADLSNEVKEVNYSSRKVYRTSDKMKKYLRFIDKVILRHLQKNTNVVHSYIKEKSVLTAVQSHASNKSFFLTDIKDFFVNIKQQDVFNILTRNKMLVPVSDIEKYISRIVDVTTRDGSIPVGFPTSPQLSNAFLLDFDNQLQNFCNEKSLTYTRYSDDIIISGQSSSGFENLENSVQNLLHEYASKNLAINSEKTRITHTGNKVKILGLVITPDGHVTINSKYKKNLESLLYFYGHDKARYFDLLEKTFESKEHSLFGMLHYANSIDPNYLNKLQRKYGAYTLSTLMEDKWSEKR